MRIGVIDVGTKSVKVDIATLAGSRVAHELHRSEVTRLGEGMARSHELRPAAMRRTLRAIRRWAGLCRRRRCDRLLAVGTHALREASNSKAFLALCRREAGVAVVIISGRREAELSFRGATLGAAKGAVAVIDVGGGSTELTVGRGGKLAGARSLPMGALSLTERFVTRDPPSEADLADLRRDIRARLDRVSAALAARIRRASDFIAVGGTAVTLGRIAGIPESGLQGAKIDRATLSRWIEKLSTLTSAQRVRRHGIDPGRADIVVAGGFILLEAMDAFGRDALCLTLRGLRTGLVLDGR